MGKKRKELSQEEIWDDSGLIESWNQSYEEYKQYHSIHARGERLKDVLAAAEAAETAGISGENPPSPNDSGGPCGHADLMANRDVAGKSDRSVQDDDAPGDSVHMQAAAGKEAPSLQSQRPEIPATLGGPAESPRVSEVAQVPVKETTDEGGLKDLMMSWYWTGYYTGLHEGQRAAKLGVEESSARNLAA